MRIQTRIGSDLCQDQPDTVVEWMRTGRWTKAIDFGEGSAAAPGFPPMPDWFADSRGFAALQQGLADVGMTAAEAAATGRVWGGAGRLCPIAAGAALGDHFHLPQGPLQGPVTLSDLSAPALILPFLAAAAARSGAVVLVQWPGVSVVVSGGAAFPMTGGAALLADHADAVTVTAATGQGTAPCLATPPATWQSLQAHVQRTYVPASDQSRRGAGAAGSDNG